MFVLKFYPCWSLRLPNGKLINFDPFCCIFTIFCRSLSSQSAVCVCTIIHISFSSRSQWSLMDAVPLVFHSFSASSVWTKIVVVIMQKVIVLHPSQTLKIEMQLKLKKTTTYTHCERERLIHKKCIRNITIKTKNNPSRRKANKRQGKALILHNERKNDNENVNNNNNGRKLRSGFSLRTLTLTLRLALLCNRQKISN